MLSLYCWIWFASILVRIFVSIFIRNIACSLFCNCPYLTLDWLQKLRKTQINGMTSQVHELEDLILLKCSYYLKRSKKKRSNLQFQCYSQTPEDIFYRNRKKSWNLCETTKDPVVFRKWSKLEAPHILISNYYKVIVMKNYGVGIKTDI